MIDQELIDYLKQEITDSIHPFCPAAAITFEVESMTNESGDGVIWLIPTITFPNGHEHQFNVVIRDSSDEEHAGNLMVSEEGGDEMFLPLTDAVIWSQIALDAIRLAWATKE